MFEEASSVGLRFSCTRCGHCCTGSPGYVWLTKNDLDALLACKDMTRQVFINAYCNEIMTGQGARLSLREKAGYACIFLENDKCSVYSARPVQCRTYPFWEDILYSSEQWMAESSHCPGIGHGRLFSPEEIQDRILAGRITEQSGYPTGNR